MNHQGGRVMSISVDDVEALRSILSSLPRHQPKQVSKQEAIAALVSELAAAQRRGYSADDLARLMSEKGIDINGPTLRNCLRRLRKKRRARDKAKARQPNAARAPASTATTAGDKKVPAVAGTEAPKQPAPATVPTVASGSTPTPPAPTPVREPNQPKPEPRVMPPSEDPLPHK
jgi:hypothetical protein